MDQETIIDVLEYVSIQFCDVFIVTPWCADGDSTGLNDATVWSECGLNVCILYPNTFSFNRWCSARLKVGAEFVSRFSCTWLLFRYKFRSIEMIII